VSKKSIKKHRYQSCIIINSPANPDGRRAGWDRGHTGSDRHFAAPIAAARKRGPGICRTRSSIASPLRRRFVLDSTNRAKGMDMGPERTIILDGFSKRSYAGIDDEVEPGLRHLFYAAAWFEPTITADGW